MKPFLSICIPTYNRVDFLKTTVSQLLSILPKTENIEIVISDNNSTDNTYSYCMDLVSNYDFIQYYKQEDNIGLDLNAFSAVEKSNAEYCWLLSDDDIPLKNSINKICQKIRQYEPVLIYLNYSGFMIESEISASVLQDREQEVFETNHEEFLRKYLLNHFSATVVQKKYFVKYKYILQEYKNLGFIRGYILCLSDYMILSEKKTCCYIGEILLRTRNNENLLSNSYNPLSIVSEIAIHYRLLRKRKLITNKIEKFVVNHYLRGFYHIIIPMKLNYKDYYDSYFVNRIHVNCFRFKNYYLYNLPYLIMPAWLLKPLRSFYIFITRRK